MVMTSKEYAREVSSRVQKAGDNADWYMALLSVALDETHSRQEALVKADKAFAEQPTAPDWTNEDLTEEDALALDGI
jgi:hypothetical protein